MEIDNNREIERIRFSAVRCVKSGIVRWGDGWCADFFEGDICASFKVGRGSDVDSFLVFTHYDKALSLFFSEEKKNIMRPTFICDRDMESFKNDKEEMPLFSYVHIYGYTRDFENDKEEE